MPAPAIRSLEPRFVFDGAAAPAAAQAHSDSAAQSHGDGPDTSHAEPADRQIAAPAAAAPGHETASAGGRREIVVIDKGVADLQTLLAGVPASAEVILIDSTRDGIDQLADALRGRSDIDAIHILSHGSAGDLRLGTGDLTAETIQGRYAAGLAVIGRALTTTGDLLIYGCDFAAGETGARATALLAQATGADVAASNDATGHAALGGDWDLEVHDGHIETGVVVGEAAQREWQHLLATANNGDGALLALQGRSIYSIDIATGKATLLTTAPGSIGGIGLSADLNSLAVDQANGLIYFVDNGSPATANKNALFAYDFRNDQYRVIDRDLSTHGVVTGTTGLGSAGAAFFNGFLYLSAEDVSGTTDQIYKLTMSADGRTVSAAATFGNQSNHQYNWGDITVDTRNNQLVSVTGTNYARFDLTTGAEISYADTTRTDFQVGFDQNGLIYTLGTNITRINPADGTAAAPGVRITTDGSTALGGVNDAASWTPPTSTIAGKVFGDSNGNGTRNTSEPGVAGVTVQLVDDVNGNGVIDSGERVLATDTTDANGTYTFTGLLPGQFLLHVTDTGGRLTGATATTTTTGSVIANRVGTNLAGPDFGYRAPPTIDLDGSSTGTGYTASYAENGSGTAIADSDAAIGDIDSPNLTSLKAVITNGQAGDVLAIAGTPPSAIRFIWDASTFTLTLSGSTTQAEYLTALKQIQFSSTSENPSTTARNVAVTVNDGGSDSNVAAATVNVTAIDDAPVNVLPTAPRTAQDTALTFASANGNAITVSDADAGTGDLTTTLSVDNGTLTLGSVAGVSVSGNGTRTLTLTGSQSAINAALDGTVYMPDANYAGPDTLRIGTNDNGNSGTGGPLTTNDSTSLTVVSPSAPVNTTPSDPQGTNEDTGIVFSTVNGNAVTVSDADSGTLRVTLNTDHGTLSLSRTTGLTFDPGAGDGTGDRTMTFTGTIADINAALNGLRFDPDADYNGPAQIGLTTQDPMRPAGTFTNGGFERPVEPVTSSSFVDDSQVPGWKTTARDGKIEIWSSGFNGVSAFEGNQFAEINANEVATLYQDFRASAGSTVALDFAHRGRQGVDQMQVIVTDMGGDGVYGTADDRTLLNKTYSDGNTAWGVYHEDLSQTASGNTLRFEFRSVSAAGGSPSVGNFVDGVRIQQSFKTTSTIQVDVAPVADIVPDDVATDEDTAVTFNVLTGAGGAAADSFESQGARVTSITQPARGSVVFQPDGTMTYTPNADFNGTDSFTYTVTSGGTTETATVTVGVRPVNDAPVNGVPGSQAVNEDADLVFSRTNNNAITISDIDAGGAQVSTTLSVQHGTLTLGATSGVTIAGSGSDTVTLVGTITDINAALDGIRYRGTANYNGADSLTITTDDRGNTGSGGPRSDTDTIALDVRPVADPPTNTVPAATQTVNEDAPLVFASGTGNGISVADPDGGSLTVTLSSAQGLLTLSRTTGLTFLQGDGTRDGTVRFTGAIADINAALEGLRFDPNADLNGPAQIALTSEGADGFSAASTVAVSITPVADIVPDAVATDEDAPVTFNAITGTNGASPDNFEDGGRAVSAVTQGANGRVSFAPDGTITYTPNADFNGTDSFTYTVTSGGTTETASVTVIVRAVNDAPVNGVPGNQGILEDTPLVFSAANGNRIGVSDADALGRPITTTLSVLHGTLTLGSTVGITVVDDGTGSVTLTGTVDAINAALDGTTYRPTADYNGADTLTVRTDDNGNTGTGGAQVDTDTIALTIAAVNDAPRAGTLPAIGSLDGDAVTGADLGRFFFDVEGDRLRYTVVGLPPGLAIDPATGLVSGTIDRSASRGGVKGDYTVTVTADDGNGGVTNRDFTWRVVNPAPIARNDGTVVDAATPATGSVLADNGNGADSDPDGDPLTVAAVNGAAANVGRTIAGSAGGRFTVLADGTYRFDPSGDFADLASGETRTTRITYTVADGDGGTSEASVAVTVTGRSAPPAVLAPGDRAVADGQTVALPLGSLFADPDGRGLRFAATGLPPGLSIDPVTGAVTGTVDRAASGATGLADYRVTITATDPRGASTERGFTLRVTNPAPQAPDDRATTPEDTAVTIDVLANDRDPDGDTLVIVATGDAAPSAGHGRVAVAVADGRLVYTPNPNFNGTDTITYTISDGNGGTSTASVTVTVSPVDDAPEAGTLPDQFGRDGAPVRYDVGSRFSDADTDPSVIQAPTGDGLRYTATGLPPGLSIDPATGLITGTLPSDASAASRYAVTVTATDASGAAVTRGFTWTVSNAAPIAAPDTATTRAGSPVLVAVTANDIDPDGDPIRLAAGPGTASAAHGTVSTDPATGLLTYTPDPGFSGTDTIVYTVVDAQGGRATGILTVTVTPENRRPVAPEPLPGRNVADGQTVRVPLGDLVTDPDGDRLTYAVTGLPPGLRIDPATGEITGTIDRAASGPNGRATYVVTLTATDPGGLAVSRSVAWTVTNPAPSAADDVIATAEDTPVNIDVTANDTDPDGDPLTVVPGSLAAGHGTVTLNPDGSLRYTPDRDFNGTDRIVYTITDGNGGFATASVTITVTPVNDAPVFDPASPALVDRAANDAETVAIPAGSAFRDVDAGDRLTFTATGLPPGLAVDPATGLIAGTIASDASGRVPGGVYRIVLTGTDSGGASATTQFTITVANLAPSAGDDDFILDEDGILTGSVLGNDRDPDGDALRVEPVAGPAHGRLELRPDGTFTYTPDADFHGTDAFTYALVDSDGARTTATVRLTVDSVNDVPTATADPLTLPANTVGTGRITAGDRDADAVSFRLTGQPVNGTVTLAADGSYAYRPFAAFSGTDSFVVEVDDGQGGRSRVTVAVTITPNPVMVLPSAIFPILLPLPPFPDGPAAPPVLPPASGIAADGIVLPAVAEIDTLGTVGDVFFADGAVVAAVNGVAALHGTAILVDRPVMLNESERIARLAWQRFERVPLGETPWFSARPYLGRSLGVSLTADADGIGTNDLMVEAIRSPDSLAINLRNAASGLVAVTAVRLFGLDGAPRPDWIEGDGRGGFWGRPPAGTGLVRLELEIALEDGRVVRRPLSVDAETGEVRALPPARPAGDAKPAGTRDAAPTPRPEAPLFTTQLAALGGRSANDLSLIERALTRGL